MINRPVADKAKDKVTFFTGYEICLYFGITYNHTWLSIFCIFKCYLLLILATIHYAVKIALNYDTLEILNIVELVHFIIMDFSFVVMTSLLLVKSKKLKELCDILNCNHKSPKIKLTPKQKEITRDTSIFLIKFIRITSAIFFWGLAATYIRRPFLDAETEMTLPYDGWVPFEVDSVTKYIAVCIFQAFIAINVCSGHYCAMISYITQSKHIFTQCEILIDYIKDTFDDNCLELLVERKAYNNREEFIKARLSNVIESHHLLIRCFTVFQDVYGLFLFALNLTATLMICTIFYMVTDPSSTAYLVAEAGSMLLPEMVVIAYYCWFGQQITDKWTEIKDTIYEVDWFNESISTQKTLLNIMTFFTRDKVIMGGGLQEYSMKGFSELLQTAFSYFNMLKAVR